MTKILFRHEGATPEDEFLFLGFRASEGSVVTPNSGLCAYRAKGAPAKDTLIYRSPLANGLISLNRTLKRGAIIHIGDSLADVASGCPHSIVMKNICGECGLDLRTLAEDTPTNASVRPQAPPTAASVSMIHHVPELMVSNDLANKIGAEDHEQTLRHRKLVLLVDLDQTLIHTTNRPVPTRENREDIHRYLCHRDFYYTKVRPYTRAFLERMAELYEMHIITFGQRQYAHIIAGILDPEKKFFSHRIMSRDELTSAHHKTDNITALFPSVEQRKLIVIIDDRDDVWQYSEALVRIRPYKYFSEVDDINAPAKILRMHEQQLQKQAAESAEAPQAKTDAEAAPAEEPATRKASESEVEEEKEAVEPPKPPLFPALVVDSDDVLQDVERVLVEVHQRFFNHYDETKEVVDVSSIVSAMRNRVLASEVVALSGVIPLGMEKSKALIYRLCVQFGATVVDSITDQVTVLIAARPSTEKCRQALKKKIPVVTPEWLYTCTAKWISVPKEEYAHENLDEKYFKKKRREAPSGSESPPAMPNLATFSRDDIKTMEDEVNALIGDDDDTDESDSSSNNAADDDDDDDDVRGSDSEADAPEPSATVTAVKAEAKAPDETGEDEEKEEDEENGAQEKLRRQLSLAGTRDSDADDDDDDMDDEALRNGDIDSRKRRRVIETFGDEEEEEPEPKRASREEIDPDDDGMVGNDEFDSDEDELEADLEAQLNG